MLILPAIDLRQGHVVRLRQGRAEAETVYDNDPVGVARRWVEQGARWLHVVNLDGALDRTSASTPGRESPTDLHVLQSICASVPDVPVQFGGGLRTIGEVETALALGAARVVLGTAAVRNPELVSQTLQAFGPARIAVAIDAREGRAATHGWQETSTIAALDLAREMNRRGLRYAVYTDIQRDGMLSGVNAEEAAALARNSGLQVIASGGVATLEDIRRLRRHTQAGLIGVIVGQALYKGTLSLTEAIQVASCPG